QETGPPAGEARQPGHYSWGWQSKAQERNQRLNSSVDAIRDRFGFRAISLAAGVKRPLVDAPEDPLDGGKP
ncbi:MAG: hypothetical protein M3328_14155, partial [Chloroflexota bacterium]|nr:hypothetical protein [Chloroflexota bacterium]